MYSFLSSCTHKIIKMIMTTGMMMVVIRMKMIMMIVPLPPRPCNPLPRSLPSSSTSSHSPPHTFNTLSLSLPHPYDPLPLSPCIWFRNFLKNAMRKCTGNVINDRTIRKKVFKKEKEKRPQEEKKTWPFSCACARGLQKVFKKLLS